MDLAEMLFGQYQLAVAGDAQTVFFVVMHDHDFIPCSEKCAAAEAAPFVVGILGRHRIAVPGVFRDFHRLRLMENDCGFTGRQAGCRMQTRQLTFLSSRLRF